MTDSDKHSLFSLIGSLPGQITDLIKAEIAQVKAELVYRAKHIGIGAALFIVAGVLAFFAFGVLLAAAVLGIAVALPAWLSALIVGVALLLVAGLLALLGLPTVKSGISPPGEDTVGSVKKDVTAIKGVGDYDRHR